jgi:hypothetical protein
MKINVSRAIGNIAGGAARGALSLIVTKQAAKQHQKGNIIVLTLIGWAAGFLIALAFTMNYLYQTGKTIKNTVEKFQTRNNYKEKK